MQINVRFSILIFLSLFIFSCATSNKAVDKSSIDKVFSVAEQQYTKMLQVSTDLTKYPRTTNADGTTKYVNIRDWTGGFWPGSLWYVYDFTKETIMKNFSQTSMKT